MLSSEPSAAAPQNIPSEDFGLSAISVDADVSEHSNNLAIVLVGLLDFPPCRIHLFTKIPMVQVS
jgi:hypothetical protein